MNYFEFFLHSQSRWSPSGGYVVAGLRNGFIIFETQKFSAQKFINNLTCQVRKTMQINIDEQTQI